MNLYEFNILNTHNKLELVWAHGNFIDTHYSETESVNLYGLDKFYVDVVYDPKTNEIIDVRSFKTGACLEKYFPVIQTEY